MHCEWMLVSVSAFQPAGNQGTWHPLWRPPIRVSSEAGKVVSSSIPQIISFACMDFLCVWFAFDECRFDSHT